MDLVVLNLMGESVGKVGLAGGKVGIKNFEHSLYLVDKFQRAANRQGTASTKNRSEISGGGAKPYKQKGTGRARRGSNRTPLRRGGAVVFGPHNRDYSIRLNRKLVGDVFRKVFLEKSGVINVLEAGSEKNVKSKDVAKLVKKVCKSSTAKVMCICGSGDSVVGRAFRNLSNGVVVDVNKIPVLDLLNSGHIFISKELLPLVEARYMR